MNSQFENKYVVGIDGCKFGWVAVAIDASENFTISKHANFNSIFKIYPNASKYLVDMVIGMGSEGNERNIEKLAREKLKPNRTSSVFTPPCREAIYKEDYKSAKLKNITITGKSISIQAWNIVPKMKDVDQFILKNKTYQGKIYESHPEICFAGLNNGLPMKEKKSIKEGIFERINLIEKYYTKSNSIFEKGRKEFMKKEVKDDDLIDAIVLAVTGVLGEKHGFSFISNHPIKQDIHGNDMKMIYFDSHSLK